MSDLLCWREALGFRIYALRLRVFRARGAAPRERKLESSLASKRHKMKLTGQILGNQQECRALQDAFGQASNTDGRANHVFLDVGFWFGVFRNVITKNPHRYREGETAKLKQQTWQTRFPRFHKPLIGH